ncbi:hypothetical protein Tco_0677602 [Tanacetum coccineum]|uniref:Uncharacterized protein n=1 Tax=Tanacetum coccineum TaxID=301880 RepID=A0ABQ4XDJ3_9ASTR
MSLFGSILDQEFEESQIDSIMFIIYLLLSDRDLPDDFGGDLVVPLEEPVDFDFFRVASFDDLTLPCLDLCASTLGLNPAEGLLHLCLASSSFALEITTSPYGRGRSLSKFMLRSNAYVVILPENRDLYNRVIFCKFYP